LVIVYFVKVAYIKEICPVKSNVRLLTSEKLLAQLFGSAKAFGLLPEQSVSQTPVQKLMRQLNQELSVLSQFNDPNGLYSVCFACQVQ